MGCATVAPEKVPELDGRLLEPLKMETLEPRETDVEVKNDRPVNLQAGNAAQIENLVLANISQSLSQGGIRLYPASKNKMKVQILDCPEATAEMECLFIRTEITALGRKFQFENKCKDQIQNKVTKSLSRGDVSIVYQDCLSRQFTSINRAFSRESRPDAP